MWDINFVYTEYSHKITTQPWAMADHNFLFSFRPREGTPAIVFTFSGLHIHFFCIVLQDSQIQCRLHNQALTTELEC